MTEGDVHPPRSMDDVLNILVTSTEGRLIRVEQVLQSLGIRSFGPLLLLTSLIELFPLIGFIPGAYVVVALVVILLAGQLLIGRPHPWLPSRFRDFAIDRKTLVRSVNRLRPWAVRIDRVVFPRLTFLLRPPFVQIIALICILMALLFFPLALIPSSEKLLSVPIFFFGLALTTNDGLVALIGIAVTLGVVGIPWLFWDEILQAFRELS